MLAAVKKKRMREAGVVNSAVRIGMSLDFQRSAAITDSGTHSYSKYSFGLSL